MDVIITVTKEGKKLEQFRADYPNIRSLRGFLNGEWNLASFDNCFKGKNRLGDVDASIEMNGHTLLIEFKNARNGMNQGQVLKAIRQAKYSGITTIFVFGKRDNPEGYLVISPDAGEQGFRNSGYVEGDMKDVQELFTAWALRAEKNNLVQNRTAEWDEVSKVMQSLYK